MIGKGEEKREVIVLDMILIRGGRADASSDWLLRNPLLFLTNAISG